MDSVPVKVTSLERARRDAEIVRDRARGRSWASLARRHGLSDRHCRRIVAEHANGHPQLEGLDPLDVVTGIYGRYEAAIDELVDLSDQARNESARVGAIKARIEIIKAEADLLQAVGLLPRDLGQLRVERDIRTMVAAILDLFDRWALPLEAQRELVECIDGSGSSATRHTDVPPRA